MVWGPSAAMACTIYACMACEGAADVEAQTGLMGETSFPGGSVFLNRIDLILHEAAEPEPAVSSFSC